MNQKELLIPRIWTSLRTEELMAIQQRYFNHLTHEEKNEYIRMLQELIIQNALKNERIRLLREIIVQEEHKERMAHEDALMASNY